MLRLLAAFFYVVGFLAAVDSYSNGNNTDCWTLNGTNTKSSDCFSKCNHSAVCEENCSTQLKLSNCTNGTSADTRHEHESYESSTMKTSVQQMKTTTARLSALPSTPGGEPEAPKCYALVSSLCATRVPWATTMLSLEEQALTDSALILAGVVSALESNCSDGLLPFICATYFGQCKSNYYRIVPPCGGFCKTITKQCYGVLNKSALLLPNCNNYPSTNHFLTPCYNYVTPSCEQYPNTVAHCRNDALPFRNDVTWLPPELQSTVSKAMNVLGAITAAPSIYCRESVSNALCAIMLSPTSYCVDSSNFYEDVRICLNLCIGLMSRCNHLKEYLPEPLHLGFNCTNSALPSLTNCSPCFDGQLIDDYYMPAPIDPLCRNA